MVADGDVAPDFSLPLAGGGAYNDIEEFTLSRAVEDGPVVLAFVPAAFTRGCTEELCTFHDSLGGFEALDAFVAGISVDLPFALNVWRREQGIDVPLLSDWDHEVIHAYDVVLEDMYGHLEVAERSVFVIDTDRVVTWQWVRDGENPDFDRLVADVRAAVADVTGESH